jgi:hypothetical protein
MNNISQVMKAFLRPANNNVQSTSCSLELVAAVPAINAANCWPRPHTVAAMRLSNPSQICIPLQIFLKFKKDHVL